MATLLEQLKDMTTIVADTGDVEAIKTVKPFVYFNLLDISLSNQFLSQSAGQI